MCMQLGPACGLSACLLIKLDSVLLPRFATKLMETRAHTCNLSSFWTAESCSFFTPNRPLTVSAASTSFCRNRTILPARHGPPQLPSFYPASSYLYTLIKLECTQHISRHARR